MNKTLTEMAAEILAARVRHEAMTSKQIESCLGDTFEALQKLKEREDALLGNAVQDPIKKPEKPAQAKPEEPEKPAVQESVEKPEEPLLEPEEPPKTRRSNKKSHHRQHHPEPHQVQTKRR